MARIQDIHSLRDLRRTLHEHLDRLRESGEPEVWAVGGKAELVVQDAEAYRKLVDRADRAEAVAGIRRGLESRDRGEGRPMREALEELAKTRPSVRI